jgi:hypothetical protein
MKNHTDSLYNDSNITNNETAMKKNEMLQNEIHSALNRKSASWFNTKCLSSRIGRYARIFSYMVLFVGTGLIFTSCMGGYIASEPAYTQYERPPRPSQTHIWIDGDWNWNNSTHLYVQQAGYWDKPRQGQSYVAGSWQTTPRGKSWSKGHWQKDNKQRDNRGHDNGNR